MAARDRFNFNIACAKCGTGGNMEASEDDYPFMRSPGFTIDSLPTGFTQTTRGEHLKDNTVVCDKCGDQVFPPKKKGP